MQAPLVGSEREVQLEPASENHPLLQDEDGERDLEAKESDTSVEQAKLPGQTRYPWLRLLRVVVILLVYFVLEIVVKSLTLGQFAFFAWRKRPHAGMKLLGAMIAEYMNQMWKYCTFSSDAAPWPFSPWPRCSQNT